MVEHRKEQAKAKQQHRSPKGGSEKNKRVSEKNASHQRREGSMFLSETKVPKTQKDVALRPIRRPEPSTNLGGAFGEDSVSLEAESADLSERESSGSFAAAQPEHDWVFGVHAVKAFLDTRAEEAEEVILPEQAQRTHADLIHKAQESGVLVRYRPRSFLDRLLPQCNHQGVALRRRRFVYASFDAILAEPPEGALLLLVGIQDPGNVGAILRSARAFGVRAILLSQRDTCPINQAVYKASVGAIESLQITQIRKPIEAIAALKDAGWWVLGLAPGGRLLAQFDLCRPLVFVLGAEGAGLKPSIQKHCDALLGIPMGVGWDSLNVSVSGGIALYEWQRQCQEKIALDSKT
ncbi:23S rRNA (guanosine(2251)-2'-O)-methyltransferase RlmB [Myxococcota bacterium]|nr:23S rRNA (guanosine(2251)-2'-O)-methyltransferase RlmB [Myxococcota bacterium]